MIVQPDFLDHWKTALLCDLLDDPCAPLYVIRLWGHCQNRKTSRFARSPESILKAICRANHDAAAFEDAMQKAGFIEIHDGEIIAHDWGEVNASLIANWNNGKRGGRPKGNPTEKTHGFAMGSPNQTQAEPIREDRRREEKIGEGEGLKNAPPHPPELKFSPPTKNEIAVYIWGLKKSKRLELSQTQIEDMADQIFCHYENCDWCLGGGKGNKMKKWPLAVNRWVMRDAEDGKIKRARA